ncbi:MAG: hypothetical protein E7385_05255 [Ruminococcaceae bacterium]|nr:hypothetical protein [Oscillospiraceae bacterium]
MKKLLSFTLFTATLLGFMSMPACNKQPTVRNINNAVVTDKKSENGIDFEISFPEGQDIKILQLSDMQMQELSGARNENRKNQVGGAFFSHGIHDHEIRLWRYVDEAVARANPDMIVLIGDNIYGELDDDGSMWLDICDKIDSFGVPWIVVFGNHDNESAKGVMWQIKQLEKTKNCVFRRGTVTGNSNYTVAVKQGDEYKYMFYMLDTNGCCVKDNPGESLMPDNKDIDKLQQTPGVYLDQIEWMIDCHDKSSTVTGDIPALIFMHIPPREVYFSLKNLYPDTYNKDNPFYADREGDSGFSYEIPWGFDNIDFYITAQEIGCTGMFMGHCHGVCTSIMYKNIRLTFGVKTGTYDYHFKDMLGSTLITINESDNSFSVENLYSQLEYVG